MAKNMIFLIVLIRISLYPVASATSEDADGLGLEMTGNARENLL
jgi:hypothetical protein